MDTKTGGRISRSKLKQLQIQTIVIFDVETTGLTKPIKITELCLIAVRRGDIKAKMRDLPRVVNKLSMCLGVDKEISERAQEMSGLSNDILSGMSPFNTDVFQAITAFFRHLPQPVCVVAHNGNNFDFPILKAELLKIGEALPDDVLCVDSLPAFRAIESSADSHSLQNLYRLYFEEDPEHSHTAEGDCRALLKIIQWKANEFMDYADRNKCQFIKS